MHERNKGWRSIKLEFKLFKVRTTHYNIFHEITLKVLALRLIGRECYLPSHMKNQENKEDRLLFRECFGHSFHEVQASSGTVGF